MAMRRQISEAARLNGWERSTARPSDKYEFYIAAYDGHGMLRERHGFDTEAAMFEFCAIHSAPK